MGSSRLVTFGFSFFVLFGGCYFDAQSSGRGGHGANTGTNPGTTPGTITRPPVPDAGGGTGTGTPGTPTNDANCGLQMYGLEMLPPDILIVLDASSSMNENAMNMRCDNNGCGATSKWALMTPAINQVVMQTQGTVNWGLKLFADQNNSCGVSNNATVPVMANNAQAVAAAIAQRTDPNGNVSMGSYTPTRRAEEAAVGYLSSLSHPNPKFIVLATDGKPNCPGTSNSTTDDTTGAVAAVASAAAAGVATFVVGISAGGEPETALNEMAIAGKYPRAGTPRYYPVSNASEFVSVLNTLVTVARSCTFPLKMPPPDPANVAVHADGASVPRTDWDYGANMTSITVKGALCEQLMAGKNINVQILYGCPGVIVE